MITLEVNSIGTSGAYERQVYEQIFKAAHAPDPEDRLDKVELKSTGYNLRLDPAIPPKDARRIRMLCDSMISTVVLKITA